MATTPQGEELTIPALDRMLAGYVASPASGRAVGSPGLVIAHGFPGGPRGSANNPATLRSLAEQVADDLGWVALTFTFAGVGDSTGSFSIATWLDDLLVVTEHLGRAERVNGVWLLGFGTGGALCICAAAADPRVRGVAAISAPADFDDWARNPRQLISHARATGLLGSDMPTDQSAWVQELRRNGAERSAPDLAPRPLLVLHGSDDDIVPALDARAIADAHGTADLRIVAGGAHHLRHDPRAIAIILGWLDRQRSTALV